MLTLDKQALNGNVLVTRMTRITASSQGLGKVEVWGRLLRKLLLEVRLEGVSEWVSRALSEVSERSEF